MTVRELINALATIEPDAEVWAEGCDCVNPVVLTQRVADMDFSETDSHTRLHTATAEDLYDGGLWKVRSAQVPASAVVLRIKDDLPPGTRSRL